MQRDKVACHLCAQAHPVRLFDGVERSLNVTPWNLYRVHG
jgi:hypothetical protein